MNIIKKILSYYPEIILVILGIGLMIMNFPIIGTTFNASAILILFVRIFFGIRNLFKKK